MKVYVVDEGEVVLDDASFVAQGGQGRVWARGQRAYKVHDDVCAVMPAGKLAELARITDPFVVRPLCAIESSCRRRVIGHAMRLVEHALPWAQLVPRASRERVGIDDTATLALVERLRERVAGLHALGIVVVDLNGLNVLVDPRAREPWLIDLDSAQTPSFPATAIAPHIVDVAAAPGVFSASTDWFAFAITSFELLCGIHPYRGTHPRVRGLTERMRARLSVFSPEVRIPHVCRDPAQLPRPWREWYRAVFDDGVREPPPARAASPTALRPSASIRGRLALAQGASWWTDAEVFEHGISIGATPPNACGLVRDPEHGGTRMLVHAPDGALGLFDPRSGSTVSLGVGVGEVRVDDGRMLARGGDRWLEVTLHGSAHAPWASVRVLGRIAARASTLWSGCATQTLLGAMHLHIRTPQGRGRTIALPELDGMRVIYAAADGETAIVLVEGGGEHHRLVLRWPADGTEPSRGLLRDVVPEAVALQPNSTAASAASGSTSHAAASGTV